MWFCDDQQPAADADQPEPARGAPPRRRCRRAAPSSGTRPATAAAPTPTLSTSIMPSRARSGTSGPISRPSGMSITPVRSRQHRDAEREQDRAAGDRAGPHAGRVRSCVVDVHDHGLLRDSAAAPAASRRVRAAIGRATRAVLVLRDRRGDRSRAGSAPARSSRSPRRRCESPRRRSTAGRSLVNVASHAHVPFMVRLRSPGCAARPCFPVNAARTAVNGASIEFGHHVKTSSGFCWSWCRSCRGRRGGVPAVVGIRPFIGAKSPPADRPHVRADAGAARARHAIW